MRRLSAMRYISPSEHESPTNKLDLTTTDSSTSDIDLMKQENYPIKTHSIPKHHRVSYVNEKLHGTVGCIKRSFAAAVGVEESSLVTENEECSRGSVSEEMNIK